MFRGIVLVLALSFSTGSIGSAGPIPSTRPNVLFLVSDDLNTFLGCYGDPRAKTPNLDKLAARGVRFDRAYCTYPLCGPSRNSFLTGLYPNSNGILGNSQTFRQTIPAHRSLPQLFRLQGYFAAGIGKLFHFEVPKSIGTSGLGDAAAWELEIQPAGVDRLEEESRIFSLIPGRLGDTLSWHASSRADSEHTDAISAENASWVLERCAKRKDRSFFLAVGFFRPHTPFVAPQVYFDKYPLAEMPVLRQSPGERIDLPAAALVSRKPEDGKMTDDQRRQCVRAYYASISFMDAQVGQVIDSLDRLGLASNTVLVFTSDHGYHMGEHGLWMKQSLFEECARVPLLIVAPGVSAKGGVATSPVSLVDLYPTLCDLCRVPAPTGLQGQSLVPLLRDPKVMGRGWALTQIVRAGRPKSGVAGNPQERSSRYFGYSLRTPRWRYTEWDEGRHGRELYDHDADPRELTNRADNPEIVSHVDELSRQLRAAVKSTIPATGRTPEVQPLLWSPTLTGM
jgi:iduronate 2-sulfatase